MTTYTATVHDDGTAQVAAPTGTVALVGENADDVRRLVVERLVDEARQLGRALRVLATDPEGTHELHVRPDGTIDVFEPAVITTGIEDLEDTRPHPLDPSRPHRLRLTFSTQPDPVLTTSAAIGRNPERVDGRDAILVVSPGRMLSRTHALIHLDEAGRIVVTDDHSGNGTELAGSTPVHLTPGEPYVVEPGATVLMGDVTCTIERV